MYTVVASGWHSPRASPSNMTLSLWDFLAKFYHVCRLPNPNTSYVSSYNILFFLFGIIWKINCKKGTKIQPSQKNQCKLRGSYNILLAQFIQLNAWDSNGKPHTSPVVKKTIFILLVQNNPSPYTKKSMQCACLLPHNVIEDPIQLITHPHLLVWVTNGRWVLALVATGGSH
jgi:hypothetical protein